MNQPQTDTPLFNRLRFVLVETSRPGNIGAAARAIKNMGFSELLNGELHLLQQSSSHERMRCAIAGRIVRWALHDLGKKSDLFGSMLIDPCSDLLFE